MRPGGSADHITLTLCRWSCTREPLHSLSLYATLAWFPHVQGRAIWTWTLDNPRSPHPRREMRFPLLVYKSGSIFFIQTKRRRSLDNFPNYDMQICRLSSKYKFLKAFKMCQAGYEIRRK